jgi:hypothetical protein
MDFKADQQTTFLEPRKEGNCKLKENQFIEMLFKKDVLEDIIKKKSLNSSPGKDKLTYGILKCDSDNSAKILIK